MTAASGRPSSQALSFEPTSDDAAGPRYLTRTGGHAILISSRAVEFLGQPAPAVKLRFVGAKDVTGVPTESLPGKVNYLVGSDSAKWRTNIPTFGRVTYRNIYRGIDLTCYGTQRGFEFDLVIRPGADATLPRLRIEGSHGARITANGDLAMDTGTGEWTQHRPAVYQEKHGERVEVDAHYRKTGADEFAIVVAGYDSRETLIVDPVISYRGLFGSPRGEVVNGMATDPEGNSYIAGASHSFPTTPGAYQTSPGDGFVTKLNPSGDVILYSTYISGEVSAISVDAAGSACVGGRSFALKLKPAGDGLIYKKDLPGFLVTALTVDKTGAAYLAGIGSNGLAVTPGAPQPKRAGNNAYIMKLDPTGSATVYATHLGGKGAEEVRGIAVDTDGNAYITGNTTSADFPVTQGFQAAQQGGVIRRSTDGGVTWTPSAKGLPTAMVDSITAHPNDPLTLYATFIPTDFVSGIHWLYKSVDGGANWAPMGNVPATGNVRSRLLLDSKSPSILYAVGAGLSKSTDGGATWKSVLSALGKASSAAIDRQNPSQLYGVVDGVLYKSTDGGATATALNVLGKRVEVVSVDASFPNVIYGLGGGAIYRSEDGGKAWTAISQGSQFSGSTVELFIAPSNSSMLYLNQGTSGLWNSSDRGATWVRIGDHPIAGVDPGNPLVVYDASGRETLAGGGSTVKTTASIWPTQFRGAMAFDASQPVILYAGFDGGYDAYVTKLNATGTAWVYSTYLGGSGTDFGNAIAVDGAGSAYVAGATNSSNFPVTTGAQQKIFGGGTSGWNKANYPMELLGVAPDSFLAVVDASGSILRYATYAGGSGGDEGVGVGLDASGGIYLAGSTRSTADFPFTSDGIPAPNPIFGTNDFGSFVARFDSRSFGMTYSGYRDAETISALAVNAQGEVLLAGTIPATAVVPDLTHDLFFEVLQFSPPQTAQIASGGLVDVFTGKAKRAAPGSILSIYGSRLATTTTKAETVPIPTSLGGTSVTVDGRAAPLFFVSPGQVNFQVPYETKVGVSKVVVTTPQGTTMPAAMVVNAAAPNILADLNTGRALAFNQNGTLNGPDNPAPSATVITVYLTGQGAVMGGPVTGASAVGAAGAEASFSAAIGKTAVTVQYLGLTPGSVGLAQANILVPQMKSSEYPLVLTVGGVASNWCTVSVIGGQQ